MRLSLCILFLSYCAVTAAQSVKIAGSIVHQGQPVSFAHIGLSKTGCGAESDNEGKFSFHCNPEHSDTLLVHCIGYERYQLPIPEGQKEINVIIELISSEILSGEVTISGSMYTVNKLESIVPVEVYNSNYLRKNPVCNAFESLQQMNGVRPQVNCNICSTGDIHINGLEGPYTMMLIDGMPIVSSLSTVYGFSGIPASVIDRIEIIKGPAGALYGSEAMGGLINIITQSPTNQKKLSVDIMSNSWAQHNVDLGSVYALGKKMNLLTSFNVHHFDRRIDKNNDNFTDIPTQKRFSIFQKISLQRPSRRIFNLAARYMYEDRFGGELQWNKTHRGGHEVYGESIYTSRAEVIAQYELPLPEKVMLQFSANDHRQNSVYGNTSFQAVQSVFFTQLTHTKQIGRHFMLNGFAGRLTFYDDNTAATINETPGSNQYRPWTWMPALFTQDEFQWNNANKSLVGLRLEHHPQHGLIFTPRAGHRLQLNDSQVLRINAGKGFRVVNIFTEDHAALTGARAVVITETLKPENSWNTNVNYHKRFEDRHNNFVNLDLSVFYSRFDNRIIADYETNPDQIIYQNIEGYAISRGVSAQLEGVVAKQFSFTLGATFTDNLIVDDGKERRPLLTERISGVWSITYRIAETGLLLDYTGNVYGPMMLPLAGPHDPRPSESPWWNIHNVQIRWQKENRPEIYIGVKNIFDVIPANFAPFLIARSHDPFDRQVVFDDGGQPMITDENPYGLTFDPTYVFAPNMGINLFAGIRWNIQKP